MRFFLGCAVLYTLVAFSYSNVNEEIWNKIRKLSASKIQQLGRQNVTKMLPGPQGRLRVTESRSSVGTPRNSGTWDGAMLSQGYKDLGVAITEAMKHQDICQPRMRGVRVVQPSTVGLLYWPEYVKLDRCGDCCPHSHECSPTSTVKKKVTVLELQASLLADPIIVGYKELEMESHPACECTCKTKAENCNSRQTYNALHCTCTCKEQLTCSSPQVWNSDECACVCPNKDCCHEEEILNSKTCRCEINPLQSGKNPVERSGATGMPSDDGLLHDYTTTAPRRHCRREYVCRGRGRHRTCTYQLECYVRRRRRRS